MKHKRLKSNLGTAIVTWFALAVGVYAFRITIARGVVFSVLEMDKNNSSAFGGI